MFGMSEGNEAHVFEVVLPYDLETREVEVSRADRDNMDYPGDGAR